MSGEAKTLSFDELVEAPSTLYDEVKTKVGVVRIGSLSSLDVMDWMDENVDKVKGRFSGLRLLARSIVNPDGSRIGDGMTDDEKRVAIDAAVEKLKKRDSTDNGNLIEAALLLNGLRKKKVEAPFVDGEAQATDASPSGSPSQPAD